jgi:hypothetical protein
LLAGLCDAHSPNDETRALPSRERALMPVLGTSRFRIEAFERVAGDPDGPSPEVVAMVRRLNENIIEARRAV